MPTRLEPSDRTVALRGFLTLTIFLTGFGGMIWALGSAIGLF